MNYREWLSYDPDTGLFKWLKTSASKALAGNIAGYRTDKRGYIRIGLFGQRIFAHRLAWFFHYGAWPEQDIDHVNGNPSDNRIANLREATPSQNGYNKGPHSNNKSGYKGVCWAPREKLWRATINLKTRQIGLGYFQIKEDAAAAYRTAAEKYQGEFARREDLNDIPNQKLEEISALPKPESPVDKITPLLTE